MVMTAPVGYIIAIVVLVLAINAFAVYARYKSTRKTKSWAYDKPITLGENFSARLMQEREQEDFKNRMELRNRTFELYEQVRRKAAEAEQDKPLD